MNVTVALFFYKIICLCMGGFVTWMGYRLFTLGIFKSSGDVDATIRDFRLVAKRAAPGTLFLFLGASVMVATIFQGLQLNDSHSAPAPPEARPPGENQPQTDITSGAGWNSQYARELPIAQAVNTLWADKGLIDQELPDEERRAKFNKAMLYLKEWRQSISIRYLKPGDIEVFNANKQKGNDEISALPIETRKAFERANEWLQQQLE